MERSKAFIADTKTCISGPRDMATELWSDVDEKQRYAGRGSLTA
jgi:hypothetical protein